MFLDDEVDFLKTLRSEANSEPSWHFNNEAQALVDPLRHLD